MQQQFSRGYAVAKALMVVYLNVSYMVTLSLGHASLENGDQLGEERRWKRKQQAERRDHRKHRSANVAVSSQPTLHVCRRCGLITTSKSDFLITSSDA